MGRFAALRWRSSSGRSWASRPTSSTRTPYWRAARMAPSTSGLGARSEPMASRAMALAIYAGLGGFFDVENFASLVVAALRAGAVRHLLFMTVGTLGERMAFDRIMRAAIATACFGMS